MTGLHDVAMRQEDESWCGRGGNSLLGSGSILGQYTYEFVVNRVEMGYCLLSGIRLSTVSIIPPN